MKLLHVGSDILYFSTLGASVVVLNSFEAARDLLDKKGALYSSRPRFVMLKEMCVPSAAYKATSLLILYSLSMDWSWNLVLMSYGKSFVAYRRVVQQEFQPSVVAGSHHPMMQYEVAALVSRALAEPNDLIDHIKQYGPASSCSYFVLTFLSVFNSMAGAIIMMITYGHQVTSAADKFVEIAETVRATAATRPGMEIVDVFPIRKSRSCLFERGVEDEHSRSEVPPGVVPWGRFS